MSRPLRDLAATPPTPATSPREAEEIKLLPLPSGFKPANEPDLALQRTAALAPAQLAPALGLNFEGLGTGFPNFVVNLAPPDTNGAVGTTQYVQWVNTDFAVFDKATGTVLPNFPVAGNTLWQGFGGGCESNNDGDPIVTYDKLADRWVFAQLAVRNVPTFLECVAVSTSSDATGTYNRYAFEYSSFDDYPKLGVWPDAYYITFNLFDGTGTFAGVDACAYDRIAMLNGQTAKQICFPQSTSLGGGFLPADVDGLNPPPTGSPNFMVNFGQNSLNLFKFHVDFQTPANSTFTGPTTVPVTAFTPFLCNNGTSMNCVPQPPGDGTLLDTLGDRVMYRLAYRNFGDHESLVVNHSVFADPVKLNSGIRWYEIQNPNGTPTVTQQSTFSPDANFRWMGSVAMDVSGDLAVGYSVSSATVFPSIAFAGRASNDPTSTLQAETNVFSGSGSQTQGLTRWGDYSAMQVDPVDDCTFWYTTEYLAQSGVFNWNTRIANFKFADCGAPLLTATPSHTGNFTQGQTGATYTMTVTNHGAAPTDNSGVTVIGTLPPSLTATSASGPGWTCSLITSTTVNCNRVDVLAANSSYPPVTVTVNVDANANESITNFATVSGGGDKDFVHKTTTDLIKVIQTGPDLVIAKTHSGPFIQGQTGTYTISVTNIGLSPTTGTVTVDDIPPAAGLTINTISGTGWTCLTASCTRSDALAAGASYPAITVTVNVDAHAPALVVNSASVSGGGDGTGEFTTDPTSVIPPPPDLTVTKTHTGNFNQGQRNAQYVLTVSNLSGGPTVGVVTVTDNLPTGLTASPFVGFGFGWFCQASSAVKVVCKRDDVLAVGNSYPPITLNVNVASNAPASVVNSAAVSGGGDITPGNDAATDPTTINPAPDLTVGLSHTPDPFIVGQTGTYTITVNNVGGGATSGLVTVNDGLPFGLNATSVSGTGWSCDTSDPRSVHCVRADALAAGASYPPVTVTVGVNGGGPSSTNFVTVSGGGEFNTDNDSASNLTTVTAPVLAITKTHTGDFTTGTPGVYTITVSNIGSVATAGTVTVQDFLPFGMTATAVSGSGWNCPSLPASSLTCTRSDSLAAGASYPPLNVTVSITSAASSVINSASVRGGGDTTGSSASDPTNINTPVLKVTKVHTSNFVVGQNGVYEITISNAGKAGTVGTVNLQDNLPNGLTAVAAAGPGWTCSQFLPTTFLNCNRSDALAPGASYPVLIVTVSVASAPATVTNVVSVTGGGDPLFESGSDTVNVSGGPVLSITKTHTGTFTAGQNGVYTITVGNTGQAATSGTVTVQDSLPFGLTPIVESGAGWSCQVQPVSFLSCTRSDSLNAGGSYPPLVVTVSLGTSGQVTNIATVSGGGDGAPFHSASDTVTINPGPLLSITKTHTGDFTVGQNGTYTITVGNTGKGATGGTVTVQDNLFSFSSATAVSGSGWSCNTLPTPFLTCTRSDSLPVGSNYPPLVITVSVTGGAPSTINTASVTGGGDGQTHFANDPTNINGPTLGITKSHTPDPFVVGSTGTYTITVDNKAGKAPTTGTVNVQDFLPFGLSLTAMSGAGWSCNGTVCTRSDSLDAGASYSPITVTVNVNGGGPSVTNTAQVNGGGDSQSHNANDTTKISAPTLAITKTHTPDPFQAGQQGTYTLTVSNTGAVATSGTVTVTDNLPQGLTLASTNGGTSGWGCSGTISVSCTRSDSLAANSSYPVLVLTVNIGDSLATIINTASVSGGGDSQQHSANDTANVTVPLLAITKSHTPEPLVSGGTGTYTITVNNVASTSTTGTVTVSDFLPFPLTATAISGAGWGCSSLPTSSLTCTRSDALAGGSSYPPLLVTVSVGNNTGNFTNVATVTGGGDGLIHRAGDPTTITNPASTPLLAITKSHSGDFTLGQAANYTITVSNNGTAPTTGSVQVTDQLPLGLTPSSAAGAGWGCSGIFPGSSSVTCSRSDALAVGSGYPPITIGVNIDTSVASSLVNQASVTGGGDPNSHATSDLTKINLPDLAVTSTHTGNFFVGQTGAAYTINVSNVGAVATAGGTITVVDLLPIGFTGSVATGTGWTCNTFNGPQNEVSCTRPAGTLGQGSSYPPISVVADVPLGSPASVSNSVTLSGIADANFSNDAASDPTTVLAIAIIATSPTTVTVTAGSSGTFSFQINLGTNPSVGLTTFQATSQPPNTKVTFSPSSLTQAGPITMTIDTSGNGHVASTRPWGLRGQALYAALLIPLVGLLALGVRSRRGRIWLALGACVLMIAISFTGCGGGSGPGTPGPTPTPVPTPTPTPVPTPTPTPTPPPTTPPGTYTMTVTATDATGSSSSTQVVLVVQ